MYKHWMVTKKMSDDTLAVLNDRSRLADLVNESSIKSVSRNLSITVIDLCKWLYYYDIPFRASADSKITIDRKCYIFSPRWRTLRAHIIEEEKGICRRCKVKTVDKQYVHHIVSADISKYRYNENNLLLLCEKCHNWVHSRHNVQKEYLIRSAYGITDEQLKAFKDQC